jgi:hypothetical protein
MYVYIYIYTCMDEQEGIGTQSRFIPPAAFDTRPHQRAEQLLVPTRV